MVCGEHPRSGLAPGRVRVEDEIDIANVKDDDVRLRVSDGGAWACDRFFKPADRDRDCYEWTLYSSTEAFPARGPEASIIYTVLGVVRFRAGLIKKMTAWRA